MTTENELIWSKLLQDKCPLLVEGARLISDPQVRYKGTIGGDIAHGDPGNDHPAMMLALGASFVLRSAAGERVVPADGFFVGTYATLMNPDEIMTEIRIPVPAPGTGYCYAKLKRKVGDFATAAAAVTLRMKGETVAEVAIALTNVGPTPLKARAAEDALRGKAMTDASLAAAAELAMSICDPVCRPARRRRVQDGDGRGNDAAGIAHGAIARQQMMCPHAHFVRCSLRGRKAALGAARRAA